LILALPALVSWLETLVALAADSRIEDSCPATPDRQPFGDVLLESYVNEDPVYFDPVCVDARPGWKFEISVTIRKSASSQAIMGVFLTDLLKISQSYGVPTNKS
jgi:hypothetical protein